MTDAFEPFRNKMVQAGLPAVAIETFAHYYRLVCEGETGLLSKADIAPVESVPDLEGLSDLRNAGTDALARLVIIKLNGGLGTSMGMTQAKSLLPVKDDLSFLDIIVRQVLRLRADYQCPLPLVLMNSFRTQDDTRVALAGYPELPLPGFAADFLQHKVPRILADTLEPVTWPAVPEQEWCPPGHGDLYPALETSGMLGELLQAGFEYAFVSNSDNLGAVVSPEILGWMAGGRPAVCDGGGRENRKRQGKAATWPSIGMAA